MQAPARNIWETRVQCICGVISAGDGERVEVFLSANFGQVSLSPPRIAINPNRLYPIEQIIRRERRFAVNVLREKQRDAALRLINVRRRGLEKAHVLGLAVRRDPVHDIPYLPDCLRTVFCEAEEILETGDHTLVISRVLESRANPGHAGEQPLMYQEISGTPSRRPRISKVGRLIWARTGAKDSFLKAMQKLRVAPEISIAENTYREGGQTEAEISEILRHGVQDRGRVLAPPESAPSLLRRKLSVCVVGVGMWGFFHCQLFRKASPLVELYVCGRNPERLARVARAVAAKDAIPSLERAIEDSRIEAFSLVLPHDLHAKAAQMAAAAGKHVLVEKPIALSLEDADAMIHSARNAGTILMVAENAHFRPATREAVLAINRGDIGEPLYLEVQAGGMMRPEGWKADKERVGGGVLMDLGIHYVRAMRLLMGEPDRVFASRGMQVNTKMSGEDTVQLVFSTRYGWQAHMLLNWASPRGHGPDIIVSGDRGALHLWHKPGYLDLYAATPRPAVRLLSYLRPSWLAQKLSLPVLHRVRRRIPDGDLSYLMEVREFLAAVAEEREPVTKPADARRDLEIVLCAYEALRRENWATVEPCPAVAKV